MKVEQKKGTRFSKRLANLRSINKLPVADLKDIIKSSRNCDKMEKDQKLKKGTEGSEGDLAELLKQLLFKRESTITAEGFEKIITECDGQNVPIKKWFKNFEDNAKAYELNEKQMYVHARNKMVGTPKLFLDTIVVSTFEKLKEVLCDEFHKEYDSAELHSKLSNRKKTDKESFHEYVLQMSKTAALGEIEDKVLIRYIVEGLTVGNEAKYLLHSSKTIKELRSNYEIVEKINSKAVTTEKKNAWKQEKKFFKNEKSNMHCFNCGSTTHKRSECTENTKCFKCNMPGHISTNCQVVKNVNLIFGQKPVKEIKVESVKVECLIDTGADVSIIKYAVFKNLKVELKTSSSVLWGFGNKHTRPIGQCTCGVKVDDLDVEHTFIVVEDRAIEVQGIIGYDFIKKFRIVADENGFLFSEMQSVVENAELKQMSIFNIIEQKTNIDVPSQYEQKILNLINNYKPSAIKKCPIALRVVPDGEVIPFRHAPSRLSVVEEEAVRKQVEEWLKQNIVRKSYSFIASRVVAVKKKDGSLRVCVDFRKLNSMVLKDCFPVPVMEQIFEKLQEAKYFTVMDLENGFFHVPVEENSKKYTAFVTKEGLFEFNVAPFGFCNSPAVFIRFINYIFQDMVNKGILEVYMDDLVIYAKTAEECMLKVEKVLKVAEEYNLKIKWKKCKFLQTKIKFLGHVIENGKIWPGEEKTSAVKSFKTPTNIKAVQSFLGLTGFFRKFIQGYAGIARPLTNLLKKDAVFEIGPAEIEAIQTLKTYLTREPVLRLYSRNTLTELHTDASKEGFGATLMQQFEGSMHPVFYWSKKTSQQEADQHSYILEVKAAFLAVNKFRPFLLGIKFTLITDCAAFKLTTTKKDIPREVARWILYLQDFDYVVQHRAGTKMQHVDFLSRYPQNIWCIRAGVAEGIKRLQQKDDHIKAIVEILKTKTYNDYNIRGGLVYKNVDGNNVIVVPRSMESEIITEAHNVGHFALQKTMHSIQQKYWIPHLEKKVKQVIANCVKCIIHNKKLGKKEGYLNCIEKGDVPLHTIHVDHLGPMDATSKQYKYIFAVVDAFTKFIWLYPTKSTGSDEVLRKLADWSKIFGNPIRLVSDRGTAFTSNIFREYTEANGISHILTTTGVARGNGQIERVNRTILSIIAKISADDTKNWYKFVMQVQTAVNSNVHSSTKISPFELMFGVKMNLCVDDRLLQLLEDEMLTNFNKERCNLREQAKRQIKIAQIMYKNNYDKTRKDEPGYKIGDWVAIKRTQFIAGKKLASEYLGPYEIIKVKRNGRYEVRKSSSSEGPNVTSTSCDNMKLWRYVEANDDMSSGSDEEVQEGRM